MVDSVAIQGLPRRPMADISPRAHQIRTLSDVAGHLTSALDLLLLTGCGWFTADIVEMLDVIDGQIAVLEEFGTEDSSSKLGV
jgi:hypothetical protein